VGAQRVGLQFLFGHAIQRSTFKGEICRLLRHLVFGDRPGYPSRTLADSTLIQIFVEMLKFLWEFFFSPPKNKNLVKENKEYIRIFHDIQFFNME
jgi:hypothetical protein